MGHITLQNYIHVQHFTNGVSSINWIVSGVY